MERERIIQAIKEAVAMSYTDYAQPKFIKDIQDSIDEVKEDFRNGGNPGTSEFRGILWKRLRRYKGTIESRLCIIEQAATSLFREVKKEYEERL